MRSNFGHRPRKWSKEMKKTYISIIFFLICLSFASAGEKGIFVTLGFSGDGKYYMFAEHGFRSEKGIAYAETYIIDVPNNSYASGGKKRAEFVTNMNMGQSSQGALFSLLEKNIPEKRKYRINYLKPGRVLYIDVGDPTPKALVAEKDSKEGDTEFFSADSMESSEPEDNNKLNFRDFTANAEFSLTLNQSVSGEGANTASSFSLKLAHTRLGRTSNYTFGNPGYKRKGISEYSIKKVLIGPQNRSLVVVIAKKDIYDNISFMVETILLK